MSVDSIHVCRHQLVFDALFTGMFLMLFLLMNLYFSLIKLNFSRNKIIRTTSSQYAATVDQSRYLKPLVVF